MKKKNKRNKKIIAYYKQGYSMRAIGRMFKISAPRVLAIIRNEKGNKYKGRHYKPTKIKTL